MNVKKFIFLVVTIVSSFILISSFIMYDKIDELRLGKRINTKTETKKEEKEEEKKFFWPKIFNREKKINILLMGTDGSSKRSDVMILVSVNLEDKKLNMLSIPRDTRVRIDNGYFKINAALAFHDEEHAMRKVTEITSVPIKYYAIVDFKGFKNIVDLIGGVDFNVPVNMYYNDPYQNLHINLKKGEQHLDGKMAEQLVRYRKYEDGDIGRIKVQQDFLKAFIDQAISIKNITKFDDLVKEVFENLKTNIELSDIIKNINAINVIKSENIQMYKLPGEARYINNVSFFIHDEDETLKLISDNFGY